MGAYGSPDTYPYDKSEKGEKPRKKCYISMYSIIMYILCVLFFITFLITQREVNWESFSYALFAAATVLLAGNSIALLLCLFKKVKNNLYSRGILVSVILIFISFWIYIIVTKA